MNDIKNATATTAIKIAVYKDGSLFSALWPHFQRLEQQGILEVVALASEQQGKIVYAFKGQLSSGGDILTAFSCRQPRITGQSQPSLFRLEFLRKKSGMPGLCR